MITAMRSREDYCSIYFKLLIKLDYIHVLGLLISSAIVDDEAIFWQNKPPADLKEEPPEPVFSKFTLCLNPEHLGHGHQVTALKITPSALIFSAFS